MPPSKDPKKRAKQLAGLRKGSAPLNAAGKAPIEITQKAADTYVKLTIAGVPPIDALILLHPEYMKAIGTHKRRAEPARWQRHPFVQKATVDHNGGIWQDLEPDRRLQLAYDKHCAECAYLLYSTDYASADGDTLRKIQDARSTLVARLKDGDEDTDSPFNRLVGRLLAGEVERELEKPIYQGESAPVELFLPEGRAKS